MIKCSHLKYLIFCIILSSCNNIEKDYYENGSLKSTLSENGEYIEYNHEGKVIKKGLLKDNRFSGKTFIYSSTGDTLRVQYISNDSVKAYEEFLLKAEALVKQMVGKHPQANTPPALHTKHEATVIYNNLPQILAAGQTAFMVAESAPKNETELVALALEIDRTMREKAPAGWKGDQAREAQVLNALFPLMERNRQTTLALFELIKHQPGYA